MRIAILSKSPQLYSTQSLFRAGTERGHSVQIMDISQCALGMFNGRPEVFYEGLTLLGLDAVIPRIGTSVTQEGIALISQFENMGVFCSTSSQGLWQARDKLRSLLLLQRYGIPVPNTMYPVAGLDLESVVDSLGGYPVVIKMIESTHGIGVMLGETLQSTRATLEAFQQLNTRVVLQEFVREAQGTDVRAFVVNGEVVASMQRIAREGEFRSNLHRGGFAVPIQLSAEERSIAIQAASVMGLEVAGVDLLRSKRGPLIMEVNASPGLEGIETTTGVDVAGCIIQFVEDHAEVDHFSARSPQTH